MNQDQGVSSAPIITGTIQVKSSQVSFIFTAEKSQITLLKWAFQSLSLELRKASAKKAFSGSK